MAAKVPLLIYTVVQAALAATYNNFPYTRRPKGGIDGSTSRFSGDV